MATTYKILGQAAPSSTANVDLITVGAGKSLIISTLTICNVTSVDATFRVYARIAGATAANSNAVKYDITCPGNGSIDLTGGITLAATDVLTVRSGTANSLTFTAYGTELS